MLHVYDRLHLERGPRRYTVEAGKRLDGIWDTATDHGRYDLWVLGPNGFHRHFAGRPPPARRPRQTSRPAMMRPAHSCA